MLGREIDHRLGHRKPARDDDRPHVLADGQFLNLEPVTDDHNRAYWVDIEDAELLASTPAARLPRLEAVADRASNTVRVSCRGVERFTLQLNDDLLDLGKPFTVVVNGREYREQRTRSFQQLRDGLVARGDWDVLFPVALTTSVPK